MSENSAPRSPRHRAGHVAIVSILLAVAVLAAACSSTSPDAARSARGVPAGADHDATLVVGSSVAPPTLNLTANPAAAIDEVLDYNVYQHLAELDPAGKIVPVLASSWTLSKSRTVYTFELRRGVRFSNGTPLTSADVVDSIDRVIAPGSAYPYKDLWVGVVSSAVAAGPTRVVGTLTHPDWEWLYTLAAYSNGVVLDPAAISHLATAPVGTGPFELTGFVPNYSVTLVRNPRYWGTPARSKRVVFRYFSNPEAENSALLSGQINLIDDEPTPQDVATFKANPDFRVIVGPTSGKVQLTMNNAYGPLRSLEVRRAICDAISKKVIDDAAAGGYGTLLGSDSVPGDPYYLDLARRYPYDPALARKLLRAAGYPHGFSLVLTLPPYNYATIAGPIVAAELAKVGIKVSITSVAFPLWLSQVFEAGNFELTIIDQAEARDISNYANPTYYWHYAHTAEVAALLTAGNEAPTVASFISHYEAAERLISTDAVNDWLYVLPELTIADRDLVGIPRSGRSESFPVFELQQGGSLGAAVAAQGYTT